MKGLHKIFGIACLFFLIFALAACGSNDKGKEDTAKKADKKEAETRTIKHAMGESKVPAKPKRIVVLSNEGTEAVLALGITPVGAVKSWIGDPWYDHIAADMKDVEVVGDEMQPNLEKITELKPDLIIGVKVRQEEVYNQLSKIAPTVFSEELSGNWRENFLLYADALGLKEKGEKEVQAFDDHIAQVKKDLGDNLNQEISVVRFLPDSARLYFKDSFSGVILDQLGFKRPKSQDKNDFAEEVTKERIPEMNGDTLFYFIWEDDPAAKTGAKNAEKWQSEKLWKNLDVVKNERAFKVEEAIWNTSGGIISANKVLDEIEDYFKE